jgi:hypothetical protein
VKHCWFIILLFSLVAFPGLVQKSVAQYVEGDRTLPASIRRDSITVKEPEPETSGFQSSKLVPGGNLALPFGDHYYYDIIVISYNYYYDIIRIISTLIFLFYHIIIIMLLL